MSEITFKPRELEAIVYLLNADGNKYLIGNDIPLAIRRFTVTT